MKKRQVARERRDEKWYEYNKGWAQNKKRWAK